MIDAVIFDKDGTLFDFNATWGAWARVMIEGLADGEAEVLAALSDVLGFDLASARFRPGSIVIAETGEVVAAHIRKVLPGLDTEALRQRMNAAAVEVAQVEATPLRPFFETLRAMGLSLGVATNDAEGPARAHLTRAGVLDHLDFIAGYDSGHGAKPGPGQLLAFAKATGADPARTLMVGDSTHDLHAGRAAGMRTVGVLTGPALRAELAPEAEVVLASIAELPDWIAGQRAAQGARHSA